MDNTRDKDVEQGVRRIIGETLIRLRRKKGITAAEFCDTLGFSSGQYAELEQGQKIINVPRWLQCISTLGGWIEVHTQDGDTIDTRDIYPVPGVRPEQAARNEQERQRTIERQRRHDEAVRELDKMFGNPSSQKTDTDTPPVKKRRPRLDPSQSKNSSSQKS